MHKIAELARFITTEQPKDSVCPVFRKSFSTKEAPVSASLMITARGVYEAHLNGMRVGAFYFAPGFTSYKKRLQVQTYDVTALLKAGDNVLDVMAGNGWHYGAIQRGAYESFGERAVIAALTLSYADGRTETIGTDDSWQYAKTGILYSDIYHGETFDANVTWGDWKPAIVTDGHPEALIAQEGEIVTQTEEVRCVGWFITPKGETVLDFGQEITGYVKFRTVGAIGERIVMDDAEVLDRDGNFYTENYRSAKSRVTYITDGCQDRWYHPYFSFQGFRYVRLTEYPQKEIYPGDFIAVAVHSDLRRTGRFVCSDPMINRLYENVIWGQRGNFLDIPTDCPQRDERLGWTGDAQVFCRTAAYNYDVCRFFHKWLHDLAADQRDDGAVPAVVPTLWNPDGAFAWGDAATVCPWEIYLAYGDRSILEEQFPSMQRWVDYISGKGNTPAEWGAGGQYGDWLGLDAAEGSYRGATDDNLLATAFFVYALDLLIKAGHVLGRDMTAYEQRRTFAADVYRKTYIGEDGYLTCDTQTAYVTALAFGLAPDREKYVSHLCNMIHANGDHLQTGFIGTAYIMDALTDAGRADVAYTLLLQKDFPSWLYCVRKGATTIWEHWDGLKPDGSVWSKDMNSFNHYAYGAVASWMYGTMAGIRPDADRPGYEHILLHPVPDARLSYVSAELDTRYGTIRSGWKKTADGFVISVSVPAGTTADVTVGDTTCTVGEGSYTYHLKA